MTVSPTNGIDAFSHQLNQLKRKLAAVSQVIRREQKRIRRSRLEIILFGILAALGFIGETMILTIALAGLNFNVLGHETSGMAFFGVVPMAFAYFHIRVHEYGDAGLKTFYTRIGRIGLIVMVLSASALIGLSFVAGAFDSLINATDVSGWVSSDPNESLDQDNDYSFWGSLLSVFTGLPVILFGIALIFSLVIAMNVVSWAVGKFLLPLNYIMQAEDRSDLEDEIDLAKAELKNLIALASEERRNSQKFPTDPNRAFALAYFAYVSKDIIQKRQFAKMAFQTKQGFNLEGHGQNGNKIEVMRSTFKNQNDASKHLNKMLDHARPHQTLLILDGNPGAHDELETPLI